MKPEVRQKPALDPTVEELGRRLKSRREKLKLSQEAVAERLDMHASNYARIERGQQSPRVQILMLIAKALETTPGALLDGLPLPVLEVEEVQVVTRVRRRAAGR